MDSDDSPARPAAGHHPLPSIALIGAGAAGSSLVHALHRQGYTIAGVASRSLESAKRCAERVHCREISTLPPVVVVRAEIIIIATPDGSIGTVAELVARSGMARPGQLYIHLSGALDTAVLAPLEEAGAQTLAMHPVQTMVRGESGAEHLRGAWFCLQGETSAVERGSRLVAALEGRPFVIEPAMKPLYHAALSIACNYMVVLQGVAVDLLSRCGMPREGVLQALLPLLRGNLDNLEREGIPGALTGPLSRGDLATLQKHVEVLGSFSPETLELYRLLGREGLKLAEAKAGGALPQREAIRSLLGE